MKTFMAELSTVSPNGIIDAKKIMAIQHSDNCFNCEFGELFLSY